MSSVRLESLLVETHDQEKKLQDRELVGLTFSEFSLAPIMSSNITIKDVSFIACNVAHGAAHIRKGVYLKNVLFHELSCYDALNISAEVHMDNVKLVGRTKPPMIWIKAQEAGGNLPCYPEGHVAIDITEYYGEVSITGLSSNNVAKDPSRQITIDLNRLEGFPWKESGISLLSYWRLMTKKVKASGAKEGIFSLPPKRSAGYNKSMADLILLREKGAIE